MSLNEDQSINPVLVTCHLPTPPHAVVVVVGGPGLRWPTPCIMHTESQVSKPTRLGYRKANKRRRVRRMDGFTGYGDTLCGGPGRL